MSPLLALTPEERAEAPRVWRPNRSGVLVKGVDGEWVRRRRAADARAEADREREEARLAEIEAREAARESAERPAPVTAPQTVIRSILRRVASVHGVSVADIVGPSRLRPLVAARQHAAHELRRSTGLSSASVGRVLGGRDHATIVHAVDAWPSKAARLGIPVGETR